MEWAARRVEKGHASGCRQIPGQEDINGIQHMAGLERMEFHMRVEATYVI